MSKQLDWPYVINMGNSILGVSVLAMPFCFGQCGVLLGVLLLLASSWLTGVACELLMKSAVASKKRSYEYLALHTFGPFGKLAVEVSIIGLLLGTCVAFHVVIGDLGPGIISKIFGIENTPELRTSVMVVLGLFVALPLGLLKNIESLSNVSAISIGFYMVFVAEIFAAAFPNLWSGIWVRKVEVWNPEGVFKCLPIFSLAFGCQTQLFVMYDALPEPSIKRMNGISKNAINLCTAAYLLVGFFGYVAFCDESISGDILMNFRPTIFSEAVKLGFVMSIAVSFPLVIFPCRTSIHTLLFAKFDKNDSHLESYSEDHSGPHENMSGSSMVPEPYFKLITIVTVVSTLVVGIYFPSIEFILAITGATMGSLICYIFPAVLFITLMSMSKNSSKSTAQLVLFLGVTILLASTYTTLYSRDQKAPEAVPSVVKVAPQPVQPAPKVANEDTMGAGDDPSQHSNENIKKDGDDVIKYSKEKPEDTKADDESQKDDKRQEPPNPHAPVDDSGPVDRVEENKIKVENPLEKGAEIENIKGEEKDEPVAVKSKEQEGQGKVKANATGEKSTKELKEAKVLLEELKEQRNEQKKLLDAQRELINELKQHQKEAHSKNEDQKQVDGQNAVPKDNAGVAPDGAEKLADNIKREVDQEVADVVKNAVDVQQEQQLHNIAKQNHQEMLESFDERKRQNINAAVAQPALGNVQQPPQALDTAHNQLVDQANMKQQHAVPVQQQQQPFQQQAVPQQPEQQQQIVQQQVQQQQAAQLQQPVQQQPVQAVQQQGAGHQQQQVLQQQPIQQQVGQQPVQQLPVQQHLGVGQNAPLAAAAVLAQQGLPRAQNPNEQHLDTQDALNYVQQQGFLPDHKAQQNILEGKPLENNVGNRLPVNVPVHGQPPLNQDSNVPIKNIKQQPIVAAQNPLNQGQLNMQNNANPSNVQNPARTKG